MPRHEPQAGPQRTEHAAAVLDHRSNLCVVEQHVHAAHQRGEERVEASRIANACRSTERLRVQSAIQLVEEPRVQGPEEEQIDRRGDHPSRRNRQNHTPQAEKNAAGSDDTVAGQPIEQPAGQEHAEQQLRADEAAEHRWQLLCDPPGGSGCRARRRNRGSPARRSGRARWPARGTRSTNRSSPRSPPNRPSGSSRDGLR